MKFTDEELSRILSAHEGGQLKARGMPWNDAWIKHTAGCLVGCVVQVAKVNPDHFKAYDSMCEVARPFDLEFKDDWTPDQLLAWLEAQGAA